jgi:hypothetical protein
MSTSIDIHHCVAMYWDRAEGDNHIIHLHIVDEDGSIVTVTCYHRDDYDMIVYDQPADGTYNPARREADLMADNIRKGVVSVDALASAQKRRRTRGDDDYSGVSLPEVGSVRESEERNCRGE